MRSSPDYFYKCGNFDAILDFNEDLTGNFKIFNAISILIMFLFVF